MRVYSFDTFSKVLTPLSVSDRDSSVRILNNTEILGQFSRNLSKSDHSVRLSTLRILNALYTNSKDLRQPIIGLMKEIEEQPLAVSAARETSLMIRRLVALFEGSKSDTFLLRAVPNFLFGNTILHPIAKTWLMRTCRTPNCKVCSYLGRRCECPYRDLGKL